MALSSPWPDPRGGRSMYKRKNFSGIDLFRLAAAFLVVAIHTSPLTTFSETGDFILTRVLARLAVPFFFMTSGFFLISRYARDTDRLEHFFKKTGVIYVGAILLYAPVNLYSGYFQQSLLVPNLLKDILFNGTFYHLWYLPAAMTGAALAWYLVRKYDWKRALATAFLLYGIGLFGDSYYGIIRPIPGISAFYAHLFQLFDHTRNGLFFAPIFFLMGGLAADHHHRLSVKVSLAGLGISLAGMTLEGLILHRLAFQRHDSMYLFLLPCMYFLFQFLLAFQGKSLAWLRPLSQWIYILHPLGIITVRLAARLLHLQTVLVGNSLIHFLAVDILSFTVSLIPAWLQIHFQKKRADKKKTGTDRAWLEIDLKHLTHNARILQKLLPDSCQLMAVLKANAYGHGDFAIAVCLEQAGIKNFAVATIDEGIRLRHYGIRSDILILGYTDVGRAWELKKYDLTQTLIGGEYTYALNLQGIPVKAHLKIDTGMHRLGFDWNDMDGIRSVFSMKYIHVQGIYSHLSCADSLDPSDVTFTRTQIRHFYQVTEGLEAVGIPLPKLHIQSSYGLLNAPDLHCDYVRAGIALYGVPSLPGLSTVLHPDLRPVLTLKARIILIRQVDKGAQIGYGRCFTAERESRIAIVPVGYGDGYPRNLSCGRGKVWVKGQLLPVAGRICMDQLAVDVTDAPEVAVGDAVTLIDGHFHGSAADGAPCAPSVAASSGSITNELLCRMGSRLPVIIR